MVSRPAEPGFPASLALVVLVAIAVLAPWPFGAVEPRALLAVAALALATAALALVAGVRRGAALPAVPLWPLAGFLALALLQLVPLPDALHALVAPGSQAVWRPSVPEASAVLGPGSHPVSVDPDTTLRAVALTGGLALLAVLAAPALSRPRAAVRALAFLAAGGSALSAYAIFARARFGALLYGTFPVPTVSPFGPFVSKNHFAGWIAMATLLVSGLALGMADRARGRGGDWTADPRAGGVVLAVVAALAMALGGLASLSRGGTIALVAGFSCFVGLALVRRRPAPGGARFGRAGPWSSLVLAGVLGAILVALVPPEAHERIRSLSGASFRLDTWRDSLRLAASSPVLGCGLGAFHDAYPRFKQGHEIVRVEHAENDYVETLAETGVAGLGLALLGLVLLLAAAAKGIAGAPDRAVRGIGMGAVAALVALAVHSAVDFNLRIPSNAALAALAAAATAAAAGVRPRPLSRAGALGLAAGALGLLVAVLLLPDRPWIAARDEVVQAASAPAPAVRRLRLERAAAALERQLGRRPAQAESWLLLGGTRAALGDAAAGAALARHAAWLDPGRPGLAEAVDRLSSTRAPRAPRSPRPREAPP
jgi:O-antigen ligase